MGVLFPLAGAGYRVLGRLASSQRKGFSSRVWERLRLLVLAPVRPSAADFEWWLGGNMPLNPYQRGQLWWWLADETRPREPQIECILGNEEDQVCDPEQEFLERTCLHGWMRVWLKALLSHVRIVSDMSNSLLSMLELPLVQSSPFRANVDPEIQRFGLMWKLYTRARKARQLPLALATSRVLPKQLASCSFVPCFSSSFRTSLGSTKGAIFRSSECKASSRDCGSIRGFRCIPIHYLDQNQFQQSYSPL